jgi:hypothetical protein
MFERYCLLLINSIYINREPDSDRDNGSCPGDETIVLSNPEHRSV